MNAFLIILIVLLAAGAVFALVRGIVAFLKTTEEDLKSQGNGPSASGLRQNKMMFARIGFQAAAILVVVVLLLLNRH
ncbi:HIG1 domain-containing protein [Sphingomonas antarctica]|uniref:twin transmembrane helix small protein n=1 Tax=Sphingomonas antarctica TaxID=2040274 RepID=UPI0039E97378